MKDSTKILITGVAIVALMLLAIVVPQVLQKSMPETSNQQANQVKEPVNETDMAINEITSDASLDEVETSVDDSEIAVSKKDLESANEYLKVYDENEY